MSRFPQRVGLALLAACALLGSPASAATISGLTVSNGSTNVFDDAGPPARYVGQSSTSTPISGMLGFQVRYAGAVGADAGNASNGGGTYTQSFTGSFTITFAVTEVTGAAWVASVDVLRRGAMTIIDDSTGSATVTLNALNVVHSGAGTLVGSLGLGAVGTLSNAASAGTSPNQGFSQSSSATITGTGTGVAQSITLVFTFTGSASSVDPSGNPGEGDEAALRLGLDSALSFFTADDYPGAGARTLGNDGIFVSAAVPEPAAEALLALGLIGLGWFEYSRRP